MEQAANSVMADNRETQNDLHSTKMVLTVKYKIYIVILIVIMVITQWYMKDAVAKHRAMQDSIETLEQQQMLKDAEYQQTVKDLLIVKEINAQKTSVVDCLSTRGCSTLPESLNPVLEHVRAFLQLQKNDAEKMAFDQKTILANINEYLLRGTTNQSNGVVTSITFGNIADVKEIDSLIMVPITLTIDFADKNGLLNFVYNVENNISPRYPMLYKIHSINYDIVKYQQSQTVTIELIGYMMKP